MPMFFYILKTVLLIKTINTCQVKEAPLLVHPAPNYWLLSSLWGVAVLWVCLALKKFLRSTYLLLSSLCGSFLSSVGRTFQSGQLGLEKTASVTDGQT